MALFNFMDTKAVCYNVGTMTRKAGSEYVPNYQPEDVFDAGIVASNLPSIRGFSVRPRDDVISFGSIVDVGLRIQGLTLGSQTKVTEFERGEMLRLETVRGSDATASLEFVLHEDEEQPGTQVEYAINVEGRALYVRLAKPAITAFMSSNTSLLVQTYRDNIINYLDRRTGATGPRQAS